MPVTTLCPQCVQPVGIPASFDPATEVRCPRCAAEYTLAEAAAVDAPLLIVLRAVLPTAADGESADLGDDAIASPGATTAADQEASATAEIAAEMTGEAAEEISADLSDWDLAPISHGEARGALAPGEEFEQAEPEALGTESENITESEITADAGGDEISWETAAEEDDAEAAGSISESPGAAVGTALASSKRSKSKKKRGPGMGTQIAGIVVFGIVGIVMGYLILKWMKAPAADEIDQTIASVIPWWGSGSGGGEAETGSNDDGGIVEIGSAIPDAKPAPSSEPPQNAPPKELDKIVDSEPEAPIVPPVEVPPAEVPFSGPLTVQQVTPAELESALTAARVEVSKQAAEVSPAEFKALCELGHAVAVVEDVNDLQSGDLRQSASALLRQASAASRRVKIGQYGHAWMFDSRRQRPGVWLIGEVEKVETIQTPKGNLVETVLAVRGREQTAHISVMSVERPEYSVGDMAGILGTIVNDPSKQLTWYTGNRPLVVLSGVAIGVPN